MFFFFKGVCQLDIQGCAWLQMIKKSEVVFWGVWIMAEDVQEKIKTNIYIFVWLDIFPWRGAYLKFYGKDSQIIYFLFSKG